MRTILATLLLLAGIPLLACPSSLTWIPSTDIQTTNVWHLYSATFMYNGNTTPFVEEGLLYGPLPNLEVGVDTATPFFDINGNSSNALWFNAKYALIAATAKQPFALAVGAYDVSPQKIANAQLDYGVGSVTLLGWRFTGGAYQGNKDVVGTDNKGYLAGIDRSYGKWWVSGDFQSGMNMYGCWNAGIGYNFTDKIQGIIGYDHYNAPDIVGAKSSINLQIGINL